MCPTAKTAPSTLCRPSTEPPSPELPELPELPEQSYSATRTEPRALTGTRDLANAHWQASSAVRGLTSTPKDVVSVRISTGQLTEYLLSAMIFIVFTGDKRSRNQGSP